MKPRHSFDVGASLIFHSPYTGEDIRVEYRGTMDGETAVVILPDRMQLSVPMAALRRPEPTDRATP